MAKVQEYKAICPEHGVVGSLNHVWWEGTENIRIGRQSLTDTARIHDHRAHQGKATTKVRPA